MSWDLRVFNFNVGSTRWGDLTEIVKGLRVRAVLHGGVESIEFDYAGDYIDGWRWAYDHMGESIYLIDNHCDTPVAEGVIVEPEITEEGCHIMAVGPFLAYCFSQVYNDAATWVSPATTGVQVGFMLTAECPGINSNQANVDDPGTTNSPWQPVENRYPGDYIPFLAGLSDAFYNDWWFWIRSAPLAGTRPNEPIAWFKAAPDIPFLFTCSREDIAQIRISPSIRDLANSVRSFYTSAAGVQKITNEVIDATSIARYNRRERHDFDLGPAPATAAAQYTNLLLAKLKEPQQSASFVINTRIYNQWMGWLPLWRVIADFPVMFGVRDLIPDSTALNYELDGKRTFVTLAAEYDHDAQQLTITPDSESSRADAMLSRYRGLK